MVFNNDDNTVGIYHNNSENATPKVKQFKDLKVTLVSVEDDESLMYFISEHRYEILLVLLAAILTLVNVIFIIRRIKSKRNQKKEILLEKEKNESENVIASENTKIENLF